ncbi:MAG: sodium/proline symporter [Lachnospiraceae bacterium]|nr:sodium/proline symporter [Lachnospiraceae bacterium]
MIVTIAVYLFVMILTGIWFSKENNDSGDFYLGGRRLGPLVTAMSAEASDMSSWLLMGLPGVAYLSGVADPGWTAIGLAVGTYLNWLFVARRLRRYTTRLSTITIPDYFSKRYGDKKGILTCVSAIVIVVFFIPYTASGFAACGKLFSTLFGADYFLSMIISAVIIALYCTLGGFRAVCTTDFIQSICMSISLIIVVFFGISSAGGWDAVVSNASALPGYISLVSTYDAASGTSSPYGFLTILSTAAWGLGYFGMPHILVRFMAIEDENKLNISRRVASIWVVISMGVAILIGIIGLAMSKAGTIPVFTSSGDSEKVIISIAGVMSQHSVLFAIIAGVILSGVLAATMSTADSQLLASASAISQNLIRDFGKKEIDERKAVRIAQTTVVIISAISVILARNPDSSVFQIVSFAWAGFGAAFGPVMLLSLFWRRSNREGALAGMITGGAMVFIWKFLIKPVGGVFGIYELLPAFLLGLLVNVIVSKATKAPDKDITDIYDTV